MKYSFVIPCYKSAKTICDVVNEIDDTMKEGHENDYEIIMVNDCSPDETLDVIKKLVIEDSRRICINFSKNYGQHSALMAGFNYARGDFVVTCDDDMQTPINRFWELKKKIDEGYDVASAKFIVREGQSLKRKIGTLMNRRMKKWLIQPSSGVVVSAQFLLAKRFVIDEIIKYKYPYPYVSGLVYRATNSIGNVEMTQRKRTRGESGYSFSKLLSLWMNGFTAFSIKPLRIADFFGAFFATIGFIFGIFLVIRKILNPSILSGWSSLACITLIIGGIILLMLGLIGEYIGRIYICLNQTPQYVIKEIYKEKVETKF